MKAVRSHISDENKLTSLKKSIIGPQKDEILTHISLESSFDSALAILGDIYGDFTSHVIEQTERMRDLPSNPAPGDPESKNIIQILRFLRWVKHSGRKETDFTELAAILTKKISDRNQDFIWDNDITTLSPFCLLYTSPSPRDKRQSRMPSSA